MRSALTSVPGVLAADVSMPDKALVRYDKSKAKVDQMIEAVKKAGFQAKVKETKKS